MSADLWSLVRVLASLLAVLVLAGLAARAVRRSTRSGPGAGLRVMERIGLTRDTALAVVELPGRRLLLGVTAHRIDLLTELDAGRGTGTPSDRETGLPADPATGRHGVRVTPLPAGADQLLHHSRGGRRTGYPGTRERGIGGPYGSDRRRLRQALESLRDLTARRG